MHPPEAGPLSAKPDPLGTKSGPSSATSGSSGAEIGPSDTKPDPFGEEIGSSRAESGQSASKATSHASIPSLPSSPRLWSARRRELGISAKTTIHHLPEHQSASKITETQYLALQILCIPCGRGLFDVPSLDRFLSTNIFGEEELRKVKGWEVYIESINFHGCEMVPSSYDEAHSCSLLRYRQLMVNPYNTSEKHPEPPSPHGEISDDEGSDLLDDTPSKKHDGSGEKGIKLLETKTQQLQIGPQQTPDRQHVVIPDPTAPKKESAPEKPFLRPDVSQGGDGDDRSRDEQIVNDAITTLLQILTQRASPMRLDWSSHRRAFHWCCGAKGFEARVDGYLWALRDQKVLAITEAKAGWRKNMKHIIMQEGGELAAWISNSPPNRDEYKVRGEGEKPMAQYDPRYHKLLRKR